MLIGVEIVSLTFMLLRLFFISINQLKPIKIMIIHDQQQMNQLIENSIVGISTNCVVVILSFIPMNYIELVPGDDKKVNLLAGTIDELAGLINTCKDAREEKRTEFIRLDKKIIAFS